ncbi:MAG: phosphoribosylamine--glycine ligase [Rickettsiales bacterium]|nr:phosphoribosylamine--glycine ligase [Rickettsiales bacterium]
MNVLVIGSGGREHAIVCSLDKSSEIGFLYAIPGNPGINQIAQSCNIAIDNHIAIADFCRESKVGLVVIGPEQPLSNGLADFLSKNNIRVFGCSAYTSQLESSKAFSKAICDKKNIKTAEYEVFYNSTEALSYINQQSKFPIVIKADGLAAGKGVIIANDKSESIAAITDIFNGKFGSQEKIIIEEYLEGIEISFFAVSDGKVVKSLGTAGDHKKVGEGETGLNTGGMGTYSPSPFISSEDEYLEKFVTPIIEYFNQNNTPFKGVLFCGIMLTDEGPYLLEYNVRFGDPEAQSILPRLKTDFLSICLACSNGTLQDVNIEFFNKKSVTVVLAAKGYPLSYNKGTEIKSLELLSKKENVNVFHAGTDTQNGKLVASGGRVLNVNALGNDFKEAFDLAYESVKLVDWEDSYYRKDIALKVISS